MTKAQRRVARIKEMLKCPRTYAPETCNATDPTPAAQPDNQTAADRKCDANADGECTNEPCDSESAEPVPLTPGC